MSLFLLDTDTLTLFQHHHPVVLANIAAHAADTIGITVFTVEEQVAGRLAVLRRAKSHADTVLASERLGAAVELLAQFPIFYPTLASLARFDALVAAKLNVGKMDLRIAAVALELRAAVVTHNLRDFGRVPGLPAADWTAPPASPPAAATPAP